MPGLYTTYFAYAQDAVTNINKIKKKKAQNPNYMQDPNKLKQPENMEEYRESSKGKIDSYYSKFDGAKTVDVFRAKFPKLRVNDEKKANRLLQKGKNLRNRVNETCINTCLLQDEIIEKLGNLDDFTSAVISCIDFSVENYKEDPGNKFIISNLKANTKESKKAIIDYIIDSAKKTDPNKYVDMNDDELSDVYPKAYHETQLLQMAQNLYLIGLREKMYAANPDVVEMLQNKKAVAFFNECEMDMRMASYAAPVNSIVDYNQLTDLKFQITREEVSEQFSNQPDKENINIGEIYEPILEYTNNSMTFQNEMPSLIPTNTARILTKNILAKVGMTPEDNVSFVVNTSDEAGGWSKAENFNDLVNILSDTKLYGNKEGRHNPVIFFKDIVTNRYRRFDFALPTNGEAQTIEEVKVEENEIEAIRLYDEKNAYLSQLAGFINALNEQNSSHLYFSNSKEYDKLTTDCNELYALLRGKDFNPEIANEKLLTISEDCQKYLEKKDADLTKDNSLNERSLKRTDIARELKQMANRATFGEATQEFRNRQKELRESQVDINIREKTNFRMSFLKDGKDAIKGLEAMKKALDDTKGTFTRDSNAFKLLCSDVDNTIKHLKNLQELKGPNDPVTFEEAKPFLQEVYKSAREYKNYKEDELEKKGSLNKRSLKRFEIVETFNRACDSMDINPVLSDQERLARRMQDSVAENILSKYKNDQEMLEKAKLLYLNREASGQQLRDDKAFKLMTSQFNAYELKLLTYKTNNGKNLSVQYAKTRDDMEDIDKLYAMNQKANKASFINSRILGSNFSMKDNLKAAENEWTIKQKNEKTVRLEKLARAKERLSIIDSRNLLSRDENWGLTKEIKKHINTSTKLKNLTIDRASLQTIACGLMLNDNVSVDTITGSKQEDQMAREKYMHKACSLVTDSKISEIGEALLGGMEKLNVLMKPLIDNKKGFTFDSLNDPENAKIFRISCLAKDFFQETNIINKEAKRINGVEVSDKERHRKASDLVDIYGKNILIKRDALRNIKKALESINGNPEVFKINVIECISNTINSVCFDKAVELEKNMPENHDKTLAELNAEKIAANSMIPPQMISTDRKLRALGDKIHENPQYANKVLSSIIDGSFEKALDYKIQLDPNAEFGVKFSINMDKVNDCIEKTETIDFETFAKMKEPQKNVGVVK